MPLMPGDSPEVIAHNIRELSDAPTHRPLKQRVAIAEAEARRTGRPKADPPQKPKTRPPAGKKRKA